MTGSARIVRGDALALPLDDSTVDLVVTSPPYFGLRSYQDGGEHYDGQIGAEATPAEFVDALIAATREMVRVVKPSGSIWVNLGDKYASTQSSAGGYSAKSGLAGFTNANTKGRQMNAMPTRRIDPEVRAKSLIGIPWRYAIRCIDDLGLILRAEVIWSKPNGLPESVTDRVRRSHETWFHFTKEPRYFSAVDEIRETYSDRVQDRQKYGRNDGGNEVGILGFGASGVNPLGKLPGSVWTIATQPLTVPAHLGVDHFAAFPMEMPRRIIRGWSPSGVCVECGEGRRPVSERTITGDRGGRKFNVLTPDSTTARLGTEGHHEITGYACACPEPTAATTPAVVLDPFGGTGTTALVAKALGRHGISVDMSADYCRLATWRTTDPDQIARAMQVDKPARQVEGQADLFDHLEETP